ncbi:MAG: ATP-binding cassette domain-containing protein [Candidatus Omnitrophica bacterium]|nr:ATP-binding cassette domain-containing protein [Candidatus Omnitrophota bacterium]
MNDICIKVEALSKCFFVPNRKVTTLRLFRALIRQEPFKKEYWVLRNISFTIKRGEKVAIIGKNGSGKTTLLRILAGIYDKTSGTIEINNEPRALFKFWIGLLSELSVIDNIYLFGAVYGMGRSYLKDKIDKILETSELYLLRFLPLKDLSMGQRQRLALSVFFQNNSDFLIFDESLAFVDQYFTQKCEIYFRDLYKSGKTVIMTSQDNSFLRKYCNKVFWLDNGMICKSGEAGSVIDEYEQSLAINAAPVPRTAPRASRLPDLPHPGQGDFSNFG